MSQTQTRKQKILGDVKKKRRQRTIASITIAAILIAIIVAAVVLFRPSTNAVPLPDYLSHCVIGGIYHSHPSLTITINGASVSVPANTFDSSCQQPIHTHSEPGILHIETDQDRDYVLGDWFLLWGHYVNNANYAIFNSTQIFNNKVDATHHLTMTVNGVNNTSFGNHVFPRNAAPTGGTGGTGLCSVQTGQPCVMDNIVITYG